MGMKKVEEWIQYQAGVEYVVDGEELNRLKEMGIRVATRNVPEEQKEADANNRKATCSQIVHASFGF